MKEKSGKRNPRGEIMEHLVWETFGKHLGSISEASEKHLGDILETFGETELPGVAKRRKTMEEQYFIVQISVFRKSSFLKC